MARLNTSHVLIYPGHGSGTPSTKGSLNTSHVLIYRKMLLGGHLILMFKYISCSYLSGTGSARQAD